MVTWTVNHRWESIKLPCVSEGVLRASPEEIAQRWERNPFYVFLHRKMKGCWMVPGEHESEFWRVKILKARDVAQLVVYLPSMYEDLGSGSSCGWQYMPLIQVCHSEGGGRRIRNP